jgi:hypothetical protein
MRRWEQLVDARPITDPLKAWSKCATWLFAPSAAAMIRVTERAGVGNA